MRRLLVVLVAAFEACSSTMPELDAGATVDAGTAADAGTTADAGTAADAGTTIVCPETLPERGLWPGDYAHQRRVGDEALFDFSGATDGVDAECVQIVLKTPSGAMTTLTGTVTTTVTLSQPGRYMATLSLLNVNDPLKRRTLEVEAFAEPLLNPPCAELPRACNRVGRSGTAWACDDTLFAADGTVLATLDGGEWFVSQDTLFSWNEGALNVLALDGGTPVAIASTPWPQKPLLWSADRRQLAVWMGGGGTRLSVEGGLTPIADFTSEVALVGLAVQADGGLLRIARDGDRLACPLEGDCVELRSSPFISLASVHAANDTALWASVHEYYQFTMLYCFLLDSNAASACDAMHSNPTPFNGAHLNRRLLFSTPWGVRIHEQQSGDLRMEGVTGGGAADNVVWLTDGAKTHVWCE